MMDTASSNEVNTGLFMFGSSVSNEVPDGRFFWMKAVKIDMHGKMHLLGTRNKFGGIVDPQKGYGVHLRCRNTGVPAVVRAEIIPNEPAQVML